MIAHNLALAGLVALVLSTPKHLREIKTLLSGFDGMCRILVNININIHPDIDICHVDIIAGKISSYHLCVNIRTQTTSQIAYN